MSLRYIHLSGASMFCIPSEMSSSDAHPLLLLLRF